tara:strand:+ start:908 stop:1408 length:501 start_codon:yes stop_codon:yes gene_type:complete
MSVYNKEQQDAFTLCDTWFDELNLDLSLFQSNMKNRNNLITNLTEHPDWNLKWNPGKHFKLEDDNKNYREFLLKKSKDTLKKDSLIQIERRLTLLNNFKLITEGGDPLLPENLGGLSLKFIFCNIRNSGLGKLYKKKCPILYFNIDDAGRNISNMFLRVYRIINNC